MIANSPTTRQSIGQNIVGKVEGGDPKEISKLVKGLNDRVLSPSDKLPANVFENAELLNRKKLEKLINDAPVKDLSSNSGSSTEPPVGQESMDQRLERITNMGPVVAFIKGITPHIPHILHIPYYPSYTLPPILSLYLQVLPRRLDVALVEL